MIEILWVMHYDTEHRNESQTTRLSIPCDTTLSASRIFSIFSILLFSSSGKLRVIKRMINEGKSRELLMKSLVYSQLYREEEEWKRRNKTDTVYLLVFHVLVFMWKWFSNLSTLSLLVCKLALDSNGNSFKITVDSTADSWDFVNHQPLG